MAHNPNIVHYHRAARVIVSSVTKICSRVLSNTSDILVFSFVAFIYSLLDRFYY